MTKKLQTTAQDIVDLYTIVERETPHLIGDLDKLLMKTQLEWLLIVEHHQEVRDWVNGVDENQSGL